MAQDSAVGKRASFDESLRPLGGLPGGLSKDITPSRKKLIDQGLHKLLDNIVTDLRAQEVAKQLQALHALQGLTRTRGAADAIQGAFREAGGLPLLVHIVDATNTGRSPSGEQKEANATVLDSLFFLTKNNAESREAAMNAGGVAALAGNLGTGHSLPTSVSILRALHSLVGPDPTGAATMELFACGGIHALVKLLGSLMDNKEKVVDREVWIQEVLSLLEPATRKSKLVANLLAKQLSPICRLLITSAEPLSLSLSLDVMEEVLINGEARRAPRRMAQQGAIAALLHATRLKGFGAKAAHILTQLVEGDGQLMRLLQCLLQPQDVACLVRTVARGHRAEDIEAIAPARLIGELLQDGPQIGLDPEDNVRMQPPHLWRAIIVSCCVGACLKLEATKQPLLKQAASPLGSLLLQNLSPRHLTEATIAASQLLPYGHPAAEQVLRRAGSIRALVAAFLEEHAHADLDPLAGLEATEGITNMLRMLPNEAEAPVNMVSNSPAFHDREIPNGHAHEQDTTSPYGSVTFHVAGREFVALGWIMERASPAIARTLAAIPDVASAAVVIPDVAGISSDRLYSLFGVAVEFASSRNLSIDESEALDLWTISAVLQMDSLMRQCEQIAAQKLLRRPAHLKHALRLATQYPTTGGHLCFTCCRHLGRQLAEEHSSDLMLQIGDLVVTSREALQRGFEALLRDSLSPQSVDEGSELQTELVLEARISQRTRDESLGGAGSLDAWIHENPDAKETRRSSNSSMVRPGSIEFPVNGSLSEIEPLPDSPSQRDVRQ